MMEKTERVARVVVDNGVLGEIPNGKAEVTLYAEQKDEAFNIKTNLSGNNFVAMKGLSVVFAKILLESKKNAETPNREFASEVVLLIEQYMDIFEKNAKAEGETE